jgi:hypothetical protein
MKTMTQVYLGRHMHAKCVAHIEDAYVLFTCIGVVLC